MKTSDFDFDLPEELIAQHPAERRDASRMLALGIHRGGLRHAHIRDVKDYLREGDALVLNNTRVIPARTYGHKATGGKVECLFIEPVDGSDAEWLVMMKSSHRPKPGAVITLNDDLSLELLENRADGLNRVKAIGEQSVLKTLDEIGEPPLPPYIHRDHLCEDDPERYQTVYAKEPGAVAAPTAGLHFTPELLEEIRDLGVKVVELTLHVGPGTFRPVKTDEVEAHHMDEERYLVTEENARTLNEVKAAGGRIIAVGSTSVRTLETIVRVDGTFPHGDGRSGIYIYPPYKFKAVDGILTNFHLPRSTLMMMMSAFTSREILLAAYVEAVREKYRFFSYGDCMFLHDESN
ncbi:tRNA preQ1(34) S-adenosylmethionine ribosyltransferase-isomerase QueA [Kiritimatiellaeota bacterium B1221]|nr:tRNA preQ1(34) S-adenosylmethionine ribosyltransferase-isomerase QueA [Kiritimatiellaeota bacterium B1221]